MARSRGFGILRLIDQIAVKESNVCMVGELPIRFPFRRLRVGDVLFCVVLCDRGHAVSLADLGELEHKDIGKRLCCA